MVYEMNWLDMNTESRMTILYLIARTQKPLIIDAKPLYILNYESFQSVRVRLFSMDEGVK